MRRSALAIPFALLLLAGACSSDDGGDVTVGTSPDTTEERSSDTTEGRSPGTTESDRPSGEVTDADLEPMLLSSSDLSADWEQQPPDPDDSSDSSRPPCFQAVDEATSDGNPTAEVDFESSDGQRAMFEEISYLGDSAEDEFGTATTLLDECDTFSFTTDQGRQVEGQMRPIDFPNVADDTRAYRMELASGGQTIVLDVAVMLSDEVVVILGYGAATAPQAGSTLSEYAATAIEKVESVGISGTTSA